MDKSWSLSYQAYLGMANTVGIDRVLFTTDHPYGSMKAARPFFDQMPINVIDKEKIAHLNAERLLGLRQNPALRGGAPEATSANGSSTSGDTALRRPH